MRRSNILLGAVLLAASAVVIGPVATQPASANDAESQKAAFVVTNGNDAGAGSYRRAIADAAADGSADVITFGAGLTIVLASDVAYTGSAALTLNGNGSIINGNGHQILAALSATSVTVNDLTLTGGRAVKGGAIATGAGDVTITRSTLSNNTARGTSSASADGGAVYAETGAVAIVASTLTGNRAVGGSVWGATGGAVAAQGVTITRSTLTDNTATGSEYGHGGAIYSAWDPVTVTGSTLSGNTAAGGYSRGGAVAVYSDVVEVISSTMTGNTTTGGITNIVRPSGGGAVNADGATIRNSTLSGNSAVGGGGGAVRVEYSATIDRSTLDGNTIRDYWGVGGGVYAKRGALLITNSTITRNAAVDSEDYYSAGGGARADFGHITTVHSTFASNSAMYSANVSGWGTAGSAFATVFIDPRGGGDNCNAMYTSNGYNYSTDGSCGLDGTGDTANGADPQLLSLGNYGGPTSTRPPRSTSPLVDAIPNGACDQNTTTDQRGSPRPHTSSSRCDIGAVELRYGTTPPRPDGRIKKGTTGTYLGDGIYNTTGAGQTVRGATTSGNTVTYVVAVQNDGTFRDALRLTGTGSTTQFAITYSTNGNPITRAVTNGTYLTRSLAPGASTTITVRVTPRASAPVDAQAIARLTAASAYDPTVKDTVRSITTRT